MNFEYSPYILPLVAAAFVSVIVAVYVWMRRSANGAFVLFLLAVSVFVWTVGYSLEVAGADLATKYLWGVLQYPGIAFAPYFWLIFSIAYSDQAKIVSRRFIILTAIIPFVTVLLALTTKFHGLIWTEYHIDQQVGFSALGVSHGLWFWVHFAYSYVILLIGTIFLARILLNRQGLYRGQVVALLVAVLTPWIANALFLTGNSPIPYLDLTPFAFTVSAVALAWAIFGFHLVDIAPLARDRVVDSMRDGMIVFNVRGNIVDINNAAARMIGVPVSDAIGKTVEEVFHPWSHLVQRFNNVKEARDEISIGEGDAKRTYEVSLSPLQDQQGQLAGRVIMVRAVDVEGTPRPRFAAESTIPLNRIQPALQIKSESKKGIFLVGWLIGFFKVPVNTELNIPLNVNPGWYQARERSFTIITRVSAFVGSFAYVLTLPVFRDVALSAVNIAYGVIIGLLWFLGLARKINFGYRAVIFLVLVYTLGFVETLNFGFSVESFIFFMMLTISSVLLTGRSGGWVAAIISIITLGIFGVLIGKENFIPFSLTAATVTPRTFEMGMTSLAVFIASAMGIATSITILTESLTSAWQKESQALNLLQQERDLLEKRVTERTYDLAKARDGVVSTSNELRKYYSAIEQSGNTVIIMDKNGLIKYVNPKFIELTGYSSAEALGKSPINLMNGLGNIAIPDFMQSEWWNAVNSGEVWRGEFRNHRKDGSIFWESATIAPVHGQNGEIINFVEIKQDITDQKDLQDQLQTQNDYLSVLHQITLDLLNHRDLNDLLQVVVDRSAILLDAPFSELMLEKDGVLVVESFTANQISLKGDHVEREDAKLSWQAFDSQQPVILEDYSTWEHRREMYFPQKIYATAEFPVMAAGRCLGVLSLGRSQPNYVFTAEQIETGVLFARLVALVLDNANLYDSAVKEISERRRAEALLSESESRFRQIVENASDIIYRTGMSGSFVYANPAALKLLGYTNEQDVLGRNYLDLTTPEFRHRLKRVYDHQYISKTESTYYEFPAVTTDGQIVWVGQNVQLIMENGQIVGFQAVGRDVTQLKQAREALSLSRDQALDANRFKSQLLSRVNHELRTPLGGILGYAELLRFKAFGALNDKQEDAVIKVIESAHYLTGIVNDLLDEAQIESKSLSLHYEYFSPAELLEKAKATVDVLANKKGLALRAEISHDLPDQLYSDINRLRQIIINLAGNAIKFTKQGEVSIGINRPSSTHWSIEVRDTGAGIPRSEHEFIFESFRQVNNSITRENRGSGLGLAITKQLVELMGGQISLESEIGVGSLFTVTLPITNALGELAQ